MKIIYIVNARIPTEKAHGYQITKMCEEFASAGAEVELWAPTRANSIREDAFDYYGLKRNFKIKYVKSIDFIRFDRLFLRRSVYLQSLWFFVKLALKAADKDAIIYTRNPEIAWLFSLRKFRTAYECHDWFGHRKALALWFLRNCSHIIATNRYIKEEFQKNGFKQEVLVAPNGVNLDIFQLDLGREEAIARLDLAPDIKNKIKANKLLLYTGSFRTMGVDKGIDEILRAIKILNQPDILFAAVGGNGKDIEHYRKMSAGLGVAESCIFVGRQNQTQLALWQKAADILLMPFPDKAHYRFHMTPLKIFEYMASGRPIIASDLPSIKEILNDETAFFCRPGDAEDLGKRIEQILRDKQGSEQRSRAAAYMVKDFSWKKRVDNIFYIIRKPLKKPS